MAVVAYAVIAFIAAVVTVLAVGLMLPLSVPKVLVSAAFGANMTVLCAAVIARLRDQPAERCRQSRRERQNCQTN